MLDTLLGLHEQNSCILEELRDLRAKVEGPASGRETKDGGQGQGRQGGGNMMEEMRAKMQTLGPLKNELQRITVLWNRLRSGSRIPMNVS
jgi:hypothetical protein